MKTKTFKYDYYDQIIVFENAVNEYYSFLQTYTVNRFVFTQFDFHKNKRTEIKKPLYAWFDITASININDIIFEINYGDREFIINPKIKINNQLIGLWEILRANNIDYSQIADCQFVMEADQIVEVVKKQANALYQHIDKVIKIDKKTIKIINIKREEDKEKWLYEIKTTELFNKMVKSKKLFNQQEYSKIIELLKPYLKYMNKSQKMFYTLCEKYRKNRPTTAST